MGSFGTRLMALVLSTVAVTPLWAGCSAQSVELRGPAGKARFNVEVVDSPEGQARGLMFREKMAASSGMLFVFPQAKHAGFWMKNTLIPLDMIFADATGRVTLVHSNAIPQDETLIDGGKDVAVVLEINGGLAAKLGVVAGTEMRHPALSQEIALWPCLDE